MGYQKTRVFGPKNENGDCDFLGFKSPAIHKNIGFGVMPCAIVARVYPGSSLVPRTPP